MDEQAARLVDDRQVCVRIKNVEGDELRLHGVRRRHFDFGLDQVARPEGIAGFLESAVDPDLVLVDEPLELGPGEFADLATEKDVQADAFAEIRRDAKDLFYPRERFLNTRRRISPAAKATRQNTWETDRLNKADGPFEADSRSRHGRPGTIR